jgi:hypothetical protein
MVGTKMEKMLKALFVVAMMFCLSGCAFFYKDRIHYSWHEGSGETLSEVAPPPERAFIGVALSGGGSRAAVYGAAGMEALARAGLMDDVTHISSVSGGGLANAYFLTRDPLNCAAGDMACLEANFDAFIETMAHNYLRDMLIRQIQKPNRFGSPTRRLSSLQDALDEEITDGTTFGALPASPVAFFNGARFDDARRFVFTNAAMPEAPGMIAPFTNMGIRSATFSLEDCTKRTPADLPVSLAVATSAGFPPLLGPTAIHMPKECGGMPENFWHLGDGGILDNSGVETLEDFAIQAVADGADYDRIIIFAFDSGRSTSTEDMMATRSLDLWTTDPGRVVDIIGKRAKSYRALVMEDASEELGVPITVLNMRYTDAELTQWPAECRGEKGGPDAIREALKAVPTSFRITECNTALMREAAAKMVSATLAAHPELVAYIQSGD